MMLKHQPGETFAQMSWKKLKRWDVGRVEMSNKTSRSFSESWQPKNNQSTTNTVKRETLTMSTIMVAGRKQFHFYTDIGHSV